MHAHSYLQSATQILNGYKGEEPFASFLKNFFRQNKKYGSRDRKQVSHLCYCYFRLGKALMNLSIEERVLAGLFLCSDKPNEMLDLLKPGWNEKVDLPAKEKLLIISDLPRQPETHLLLRDVFPWKEELSEGIDYEKFCGSFLIQPDLFIRLRPGYENKVKTKLLGQGINFSAISPGCLSLPNASRIENIIELDREAVVQDFTSQQTGAFLKNFKFQISNQTPKIWDCCAASGGKSLMVYDIDPGIELTVSDIRESILRNLKKRFAKAG